MLLAIINAQPENSYAYTALLSCFVFKYENASVTEEMLADMSTILEILDITEASIPQVESNDHYQRKRQSSSASSITFVAAIAWNAILSLC